MKYVICCLNNRVSPLINYTEELVLVSYRRKKGLSIKTIKVAPFTPQNLLQILKDEKIKHIICGGLKKEYFELLKNNKIKVNENVIGELNEVIHKYVIEGVKK